MRSYTLPGSLDESTQEVEESSNVGVEGVYMYRVDQKKVIDPGGRFEVLSVSYKKLSDKPSKGLSSPHKTLAIMLIIYFRMASISTSEHICGGAGW